MSVFKKAKRKGIPLKIGVSGPSGSGKTYSALLLAKGLVGSLEKVALVDTENKSSELYSDIVQDEEFSMVDFQPPFHPDRYVKLIKMAVDEGFECLIIDSTTHEWDGPGGVLEIHSNMPGNSFTNWKKVNPIHDTFVTAILQSPIHIICTMRRKQDYAMVQEGGKTRIEKMGMKEIQRDGFEYELTVNFNIEMNHMAVVSKDRTNLFSDTVPFYVNEETGQAIREWNNG